MNATTITRSRWGNWNPLLILAFLFFSCAACAQTVFTDGVSSVSPNSAPQGDTNLLVTFDLAATTPPTPPGDVNPSSAAIGTLQGSSLSRSGWQVTARFNIPSNETEGLKIVQVVFPAPPEIGGTIILQKADAFTVLASSEGESEGEGASEGQREGMTSEGSQEEGESEGTSEGEISGYPIVDTGQPECFNDTSVVACPSPGEAFYGQDSQHAGNSPSFTLSEDGLTVHDNLTGLTWQQSTNTDGDSDIDADDKFTWSAAQNYPTTLNSQNFGGYHDWRLPTIKELYSLIDFSGTDPSGYEGSDTSGLIPFIDTNYFAFAYGDTAAGERIIDSQYASSTLYVSTAREQLLFGVNFADGRIKGYGLTIMGSDKTFFVICVRGNANYGKNDFVNNGDGTISDRATELMWTQADSGTGKNWQEALAWVAMQNAAGYLGHTDWRLPNTKELQSIVDYTRSPDTTSSAAISTLFNVTAITNEAGQADYPCYWSSTTHENWTSSPGNAAAYVAFGRAMGYMNSTWVDVHGAGAQRSDPKAGDPADYPTGRGPQGDAIRIYNYVRLVRDMDHGEGEGEGVVEGQPEGAGEGTEEGQSEGVQEGEGLIEGSAEGQNEGLSEGEGVQEGAPSEGTPEEGEGYTGSMHSADENGDGRISLSELLRVIQFYNSGGLHCQADTEDGFAPETGDTNCSPHNSDYTPQDWRISLSELLRLIQFYNSNGYHCQQGTEDGFAPDAGSGC